MPRKSPSTRLAACLLIFALAVVGSLGLTALNVAADTVASARISDLEVTTRDGSYTEGQPLIAGVNYQITFTLEIAPGVNDNAVLGTALERSGDRFWSLETDYEGIDLGSWQPGQQTISFNAKPGTPTLRLTGFVPEEFTATILPDPSAEDPEESSLVWHRSGTIAVTSLALQSGGLIEKRVFDVIDNAILSFQSTRAKKQEVLDNTATASEYKDLVRDTIARADALAGRYQDKEGDWQVDGLVEQATALLQTIPDSGWPPAADSDSSSMLTYILVAIFAVIAIITIVILIRTRATVSFLKQRADDQAKKLDIIESRVVKIGEKSLAGDITQVKDALRSMSGR